MLTLEKFLERVDGLEEARILLAALEFKIFTVLDRKKMTSRQIALKSKCHPEAMESLLNALVALGALRLRAGKYSSAPDMYKHFCESSPHYKKGTVHLKKENNDEWTNLITAIRKGRDPKDFEGGDNPKFRRNFTFAMHERSLRYRDEIARIVARQPVGKLLDIGAGPASYSAAILQKDKNATATALDRSTAIKVAKELIGDSPLNKRFRFVSGDLFDTPYGKGYDTVFFSNILHIYNRKQNKVLLKKINGSLVKGGRLILVDFFLKENRVEPYNAALFSLTMLMFTATGKTYSFAETEKLLSECGFHKFTRQNVKEGSAIIQAYKK